MKAMANTIDKMKEDANSDIILISVLVLSIFKKEFEKLLQEEKEDGNNREN